MPLTTMRMMLRSMSTYATRSPQQPSFRTIMNPEKILMSLSPSANAEQAALYRKVYMEKARFSAEKSAGFERRPGPAGR